jgi:uncharacterized protein (TIGR02246 family)
MARTKRRANAAGDSGVIPSFYSLEPCRLFEPSANLPRMALEGDFGDLDALPQSDQDEVAKTLTALLEGFQQRNADKLTGIYSTTADWVNAFGTTKRGGDDIVAYLRGLFADDNFNAGTLKAPPDSSLRVLTPDVILVSTHLRVEGQKLVGGGEIAERDNFSLRVLQRQPDGRWLIVSEMYNDANRESTYEAS